MHHCQKLFILLAGLSGSLVACQGPQAKTTAVAPKGVRLADDDALPTNVLYVASNNPDGESDQEITSFPANRKQRPDPFINSTTAK